ncbi:MAG: nucleoside deaminase [Nitrospirota bacterium]
MDRRGQDIYFMRLALEEASLAFEEAEVPVGAVLVKEGNVIARSHNCREASNDPTGHAEILVLRSGSNNYPLPPFGKGGWGGLSDNNSRWRLTDATLYVTKEPCIMCAGAMINARLGRLVYGCKDEKGGAVDSLYNLLSDKRLNHQVEVVSGMLEDECAEILKRFFRSRR